LQNMLNMQINMQNKKPYAPPIPEWTPTFTVSHANNVKYAKKMFSMDIQLFVCFGLKYIKCFKIWYRFPANPQRVNWKAENLNMYRNSKYAKYVEYAIYFEWLSMPVSFYHVYLYCCARRFDRVLL
jgi:hypothetical protein